jgi:hypothetical protein
MPVSPMIGLMLMIRPGSRSSMGCRIARDTAPDRLT